MSDTKNRTLENQKLLFLNIQKCRKKIRERFNSFFSLNNLPITFDQWLILQQINNEKGINQKTIASNLFKEVAAVSRIINKLEKQKLITRTTNEKNLREFKTYLAPQGVELLERISDFEKKTYKNLFNGVYEQEINVVNDVLKRVYNNE